MISAPTRNFGDIVMVLDHRGRHLDKGKIVGRIFGRHEMHYDVYTSDGQRLCAIPESRLRELEAEPA